MPCLSAAAERSLSVLRVPDGAMLALFDDLRIAPRPWRASYTLLAKSNRPDCTPDSIYRTIGSDWIATGVEPLKHSVQIK